VNVPPLRRRVGDIQGLALFFLMQLNEQHETSLNMSEDALSMLSRYEWPGNVRQLRHAVERAYIVSEGEIAEDGFVFDEDAPDYVPSEHAIPIRIGDSLAECERKIILANLEHNDGDKKITAAVLGVSLKTLYNRLRDYGDADSNKEEAHDSDVRSA
jgi:DNA-binding NtrC family response regulator